MRTNVNLPDDLHARFKRACDGAGVTMAEVIQSYIIDELDEADVLDILRARAAATVADRPTARHADKLAARRAEIMRRIEAGESQKDVARALGLTKSAICKAVARARAMRYNGNQGDLQP